MSQEERQESKDIQKYLLFRAKISVSSCHNETDKREYDYIYTMN